MNVARRRNQDALSGASQSIHAGADLVQSAGEKTLETTVLTLIEGGRRGGGEGEEEEEEQRKDE